MLLEFDNITREAVYRIMGGPLTHQAWCQAKLPVSMGGLGLRAAQDHSDAAFASSITSAHPLCSKLLQLDEDSPLSLPQELLTNLSAKMGEEVIIASESLVGRSQRELSSKRYFRMMEFCMDDSFSIHGLGTWTILINMNKTRRT